MFCYQSNYTQPTKPVDESQFGALVRATKWAETIDEFRRTGDQSLKRKLPAFIFQATFDETVSKSGKTGAWRKQKATRLTGLVVMDIDHVEQPKEVYEAWLQAIGDLKSVGVLLVYITPSGKGLKVVFKADERVGNLIDNQHAMAARLGVEVDEACKDASRMSFVCKESDILFLDKELFSYENKAFADKYNAAYRDGQSGPTVEVRKAEKASEINPQENGSKEGETIDYSASTDSDLRIDGVLYKDIVEEWWRQTGGVPKPGKRNIGLYQLALSLRAICDNDKEVLMQVVPPLGLDKVELERIIDSACKETPKGLSKQLKQVLQKLGVSEPANTADTNSPSTNTEASINQQLWQWGEQIEALFDDYPLLRDVCKGLKRNQYPAALFVGGGLMMTLMTRCTYRFYHRPEELRRLNNSTLIIGDPACGKSFATRLFRLLAAPMVEADKAGIAAINAYKEQMRTKGSNKEKPQRPKALVRVHPARTSNAQFIQDMVNAVEVVDGEEMQLHMLTFDTELDNTICVQRGGSWIDKMSMELKAFHNEEDGQAYSNLDSVMQNFNVTWNYIYTGTPNALKKKVNTQNFGSGLATRLTCIPLPSTNFEMMELESTVDEESDKRLKEWAYKLDKTKGELSLQKIVREAYDWTARRMEDAKEDNSRTDEMLLKRCAYHGINFSAPFILMRHWDELKKEGEYWCGAFETDDTDWQLAMLISNIQFACQRHFFGALADQYFDDKLRDAVSNTPRRAKTIEAFNRLPEEFTTDDVMRCFNLNVASSARSKVYRFMMDGIVEKIEGYFDNGTNRVKYRKKNSMMI